MRKVYIEVISRIIVRANDDQSIDEVLENMDYNFISNSDGADIEDMEIRDWEVKDSK